MRGILQLSGLAAVAGVGILAVACVVLPEVVLQYLSPLVGQMRSPQRAVEAVRAFGIALVGLMLLGLAGRRRVLYPLRSATACLFALRGAHFWLVTLAAAIALRLSVAIFIPYEPTSDAWWYREAAASLASGSGFAVDGMPTAYRSPGYPFLLSLTFRWFGPQVGLAWLWGSVATLALLGSVFLAARHIYGESVARLATLGVALYPALVFHTGQLLSDLVFSAGVWVTLAVTLLVRPAAPSASIGIGLAAGLLTLCRGAGVGLFVLFPLLWQLRAWNFRQFALSLLLSAMSFLVVVTPWMARNAAELGSWSIGTNLGVNLYIGNHAGASGTYDSPASGFAVPSGGGENQRDLAFFHQAVSFVLADPWGAAALLPRKLIHLYALETSAVTSLFQGEAHGPDGLKYLLHGVSQLSYLLVGAAVLFRLFVGAGSGQLPSGVQLSGWLLAGYFTVVALVFHGGDRYRLPILPLLLIEAALGVMLFVQPRSRSIKPFNSSSEEK